MAKKITTRQKRWLLSAHVLFTVAWLGTTYIFLSLLVITLNTDDSAVFQGAFRIMEIVDSTFIRVAALGTLITGILLSVLTKWGLFRFYWIIVKEIITVISLGLGIFGMHGWHEHVASITSEAGLQAMQNPAFLHHQRLLFVGVTFQVFALSIVVIISMFKPWGQRRTPHPSGA